MIASRPSTWRTPTSRPLMTFAAYHASAPPRMTTRARRKKKAGIPGIVKLA